MSYHQLGAVATGDDVALAQRAGIPVEVLLGIRQIESGGNPRSVRFEPHVFHRITGTGKPPGSGRTCTTSGGSNPCVSNELVAQIRHTGVPYTPSGTRGAVDMTGSHTNRAAFERAARYDQSAAIRSTSWGLYQVLGGHLLRVHPSGPVQAFDSDPARVSDELLVSWFSRSPAAQRAAQAFDSSRLAQLYNGSERWGQRLSEHLARLRREGLQVTGEAASLVSNVPIVPIVGAAAVTVAAGFAFWAWWRSR